MPPIGIILGKQPSVKPLSFKDTLRVSSLLAGRLTALSKQLAYPFKLDFDVERAIEINAALKAIDTTSNGSVSRETIDEWLGELCTCRDQLAKWCIELVTFRKSDERHDDDDHAFDDEIPF